MERDHPEIFLIPYGKKFLVYAPVKRVAALVNAEAATILRHYLKTGEKDFSEQGKVVFSQLDESGFLAPDGHSVTFPEGTTFLPNEVTLFPTSDCNLRCVYCYASAGTRKQRMSWEIAKAAVDTVFANAKRIGLKGCVIGFHGGGEPSLEWDLIRRVVEYVETQAARSVMDARIHMATNGILSSQQRHFIRQHFSSVNVSLDGPAEIQDSQRPRTGGSGSYRAIAETLRDFDEHGFEYGIRPTITKKSVSLMPEMVDFFHDSFKLTYVHFEPLFYCGRCLTSKWEAPGPREFVHYFRVAHQRGQKRGMKIYYSGARVDVLTTKFCAAAGDGFAITPTGKVTSCFEVSGDDDPRSETFHFGQFDAARKTFTINQQKLLRLQKLTVANFPYCSHCFCKWHCAGDCLAKVLPHGDSERHAGSERCTINRSLTRMQIIQNVKTAERGDTHEEKSSR